MTEPTNLKEVIDLLYHLNSKLISLKWIGQDKTPTNSEIIFLNEALGECIKVLRKVQDG